MTNQDERTIQQWAAAHPAPVTIRYLKGTGDADASLARFCDQLGRCAPGVTIKTDSDAADRAPALVLGVHQNITYQAVPQGKELPPFFNALNRGASDASQLAADLVANARRIEMPADLTLFITMQCPHCPLTVDGLLALADIAPDLQVTVIDGMRFTETAEKEGVRAVPTLVLDGHLRWTGHIDLAEVIDQCRQRDPSQLTARCLRQIIEAGEAPRLSTMMIEQAMIFPSFLDLLVHPRWSVRLGAMVTVEYLVDEAPGLAARLVQPLWSRFGQLDASAQGDVVQVMAQTGTGQARQLLSSIAEGAFDPSVKTAAVEELADWTD
ncbi:MAG: hypothetical protein HKP58_00875 [Desulfatitalea sp.]|nr:thioredoxin family protein [Desulfatitalea sp.]NNJ98938.1 hypothetical protein [Desulfatitalea sp.]